MEKEPTPFVVFMSCVDHFCACMLNDPAAVTLQKDDFFACL